MTNKTAAAAIRFAIKVEGFAAKVRVAPGGDAVQVIVPAFEARFTPDQIETFCRAALALGMTFVQRLPIDITLQRQMTGRHQGEFYL
jgi:hypothetical protein